MGRIANAPEVKRERRCKEGISHCFAKPYKGTGRERGKAAGLKTAVQTGKFRSSSGTY